ncbi:hypothetical protein LEMLEM_LOCUS25522 [Lemmus lemmus]
MASKLCQEKILELRFQSLRRVLCREKLAASRYRQVTASLLTMTSAN